MRIRQIHPEFLDSVSLNNCSEGAQLFFVKLWLVADDDGLLHGDVRWLASRIHPRRTDTAMMIPSWLDELEREGCLQRYVVNDVEYLNIPKWKKWQRVCHPTKSRLPVPPKLASNSRAILEETGKPLENNEKEANSRGIRERMEIPRTADGKIDLQSEWLKEVVSEIMVGSVARGSDDVALRSASLLGRSIGMFPDGRVKPGDRKGEGSTPATAVETTKSPAQIMRESAAEAAAQKDTGGNDTGGKDTGGKDTGGKDTGGKDGA